MLPTLAKCARMGHPHLWKCQQNRRVGHPPLFAAMPVFPQVSGMTFPGLVQVPKIQETSVHEQKENRDPVAASGGGSCADDAFAHEAANVRPKAERRGQWAKVCDWKPQELQRVRLLCLLYRDLDNNGILNCQEYTQPNIHEDPEAAKQPATFTLHSLPSFKVCHIRLLQSRYQEMLQPSPQFAIAELPSSIIPNPIALAPPPTTIMPPAGAQPPEVTAMHSPPAAATMVPAVLTPLGRVAQRAGLLL